MFGSEGAPYLPRGQREKLNRVPVHKSRIRPNEFEFPIFELLPSVIRELADASCFAPHHTREVESDFAGLESPNFSTPREMQNLRCIEQRLARNTTTKNAQAADFRTTLYDDGFQSSACGSSRRRVARA